MALLSEQHVESSSVMYLCLEPRTLGETLIASTHERRFSYAIRKRNVVNKLDPLSLH